MRYYSCTIPHDLVPRDSVHHLQGLRDVESMSVLDVAAGHGMYGIECARRHRGISVTALGSLHVLQKVGEMGFTLGSCSSAISSFFICKGTYHCDALNRFFLFLFSLHCGSFLLCDLSAAHRRLALSPAQVAVPNAKKAGILPPGTVATKVTIDTEATAPSKSSPEASANASSSKGPIAAAARYRLMEGDALKMDSWGKGVYDIVMLPHYLHLLDNVGVRAVLDKARRALKPEGRSGGLVVGWVCC